MISFIDLTEIEVGHGSSREGRMNNNDTVVFGGSLIISGEGRVLAEETSARTRFESV